MIASEYECLEVQTVLISNNKRGLEGGVTSTKGYAGEDRSIIIMGYIPHEPAVSNTNLMRESCICIIKIFMRQQYFLNTMFMRQQYFSHQSNASYADVYQFLGEITAPPFGQYHNTLSKSDSAHIPR